MRSERFIVYNNTANKSDVACNRSCIKGFTFIEIAVVVGILGLIFVLGLPVGIEAYKNYLLTSEIRNFLTIIRRAENLAFSNNYESAHGLALEPDRFVLFRGNSYALRNPSFDEEYLRSPSISVTGFSELIFSPLSGTPNATATITFSNNLRSQELSINEAGVIFW